MNNSEWEKEFDENFKHVHHPFIQAENVIHDTESIKQFIRETIAKAETDAKRDFSERVIKKLGGMTLVSLNETKKSAFGMVGGDSPVVMSMYNQALEEAADVVREMTNQK